MSKKLFLECIKVERNMNKNASYFLEGKSLSNKEVKTKQNNKHLC